jgi:hypothetical protein
VVELLYQTAISVMSNPLVVQIIGGLLAIFFIFLMVMCWKTWRVTHILFTFFVFAGTVTFFAFASFVLKTHAAWRTHYVSYSAAIDKAEAEQEILLQGDLLEAQQSQDCIRSVRARLNDAVVDRGRVWPECSLTGPIDADTFRVRTVPASLPPTAQPTPNGIQPKTMMYVFAERMGPEGFKVPAYYLGEYVVDAASDMEVTISATLPLDPDQLQMINQQGMTWALYELMPLDGHEVFAEMDEQEKMLLGLEIEELKKYIPNSFNWPADKYEAFLQKFYRFNREATDEDPPEETWIQVKFVKPHSIQVDSDAEQSVLEGEGRYFDSSGRAIEGRLRQGEDGTVRFEVGDTGVFDVETADTLISDGVAEKVKSVYRRPLHDYEQFFRKAYYRNKELAATKQRVERDTNTLVALKAKADEQIAFRQDEKLKLEQDLVGFKTELADVKAYDQALQATWKASRNRLSEMYRTNNQLAEELTRIQYQLANEINRRAAQPAPPAAPASAE